MSRCNGCLQGTCRQHPLQDHGQRESSLKAQLASTASERAAKAYRLIQTQLEKIEEHHRATSAEAILNYREQMEHERSKAENRGQRKISSEHINLAKNTGLHGSVLSIMMNKDDSDRESSGSSTTASNSVKKRKKKEKKSKKRKKESKERKEKKRKIDESNQVK